MVIVSPAFVALGLLGVFGGPRPWPWRFSIVYAGITGVSLESWNGLPLWIAWIWSTLPWGVAVVTIATATAVEKLRPSWDDSARLVGVSSLRIWKALNWPLVRPISTRAAAFVFVTALVEPGAPFILGLRRTLAYQVVQSARGSDAFPAAAVWALMAGLFGLAGWMIWRWLGGSPMKTGEAPGETGSTMFRVPRATPPLHAMARGVPLATWAIIGWFPVVGLARLALSARPMDSTSASGILQLLRELMENVDDPFIARMLANSLVLGVVVSSTMMLAASFIGASGRGASSWWRMRLVRPMVVLPPLVLGVGVLAIPWLAALASAFLTDVGGWGPLAHALGSIAGAFEPRGRSLVTTSCAVALVFLPRFFWCCRREPLSETSSPRARSAFDSALLAGASRVLAIWLVNSRRVRRLIGWFSLVSVLAATNLTPALLFEPLTGGQCIAPTVVLLATGPGEIPARAGALALCAIAANVAALAVARSTSELPRWQDLD
jgi:iron(III) transport system permease protein